MPYKKIVILGTGGTIAGTATLPSDNIGYTAAQLGVEELLKAIPGLSAAGKITSEQVAQLDSKDMTFDVWLRLAARVSYFLEQSDVQGVVITHGTDTIEETAFFLHLFLGSAKPVVLTCAMRPASSLLSDGLQNITDAVAVARELGASGVTVVCAGEIHTAVDVQKMHTYKLDAFSSGDAGPLGYVEEGRVRTLRRWPAMQVANRVKTLARNAVAWPVVEIVMSYPGASGAMVSALVASGVKGIVAAGTGNGTLHEQLEAALLHAKANGVRVVRATRCATGRVIPRNGDPFEDSQGLSPVKARIALMLDLMAQDD